MEKSILNLINSSFSSGFAVGDSFANAIKHSRSKNQREIISTIFTHPAPVLQNATNVNVFKIPEPPPKTAKNFVNQIIQTEAKDNSSTSRPSRNKKRKHKRRKSSNASKSRSRSNTRDDHEGSEDVHLKVNNSLIQFLEISMKHKKERDAERKRRQEEEKHIQYVDVSEAPYGSATGKKYWQEMDKKGNEQRRKMKELVELYGPELAPEIAGIETTMQLNFERHCTKTKPALWPITPLNMNAAG